jgi:RimJ/RimL family protein N-acetyltransferase
MRPQTRMTTALGIPFDVRPLRRDDRELIRQAFERLGERSRRDRFLGPKPRLSEAELDTLSDVDHRRHEALAAIDPADGELVAVARYMPEPGAPGSADLAIAVVDAWQGQGVGTLLGRRLLARATENGIERLTASAFVDNRRARAVLSRLGFRDIATFAGVVDFVLA